MSTRLPNTSNPAAASNSASSNSASPAVCFKNRLALPSPGFHGNRFVAVNFWRRFGVSCCADSSPVTSKDTSSTSAGKSSKKSINNSQERGNFVDTRIHWGSSDEGWICGDEPVALPSSSGSSSSRGASEVEEDMPGADLRDALVELLLQASGTHYQFLGVSPTADLDEIKTAYRKLSKQYHPDTTSLPLEVAAQKFVRLKEAYNILSSDEDRRFYDWKLAQEISNQQDGRFIRPYEFDRSPQDPDLSSYFKAKQKVYEHRDMVDILGGRNMPLSPLAQAGLLFDFFALFVAISTIVYVAFFKHN